MQRDRSRFSKIQPSTSLVTNLSDSLEVLPDRISFILPRCSVALTASNRVVVAIGDIEKHRSDISEVGWNSYLGLIHLLQVERMQHLGLRLLLNINILFKLERVSVGLSKVVDRGGILMQLHLKDGIRAIHSLLEGLGTTCFQDFALIVWGIGVLLLRKTIWDSLSCHH